MATPRGKIVRAVRPVFTASGKEVAGKKTLLVCYVKSGSRRMRDQFENAVRQLGLEVKAVQDVYVPEVNGRDGYLTAYETVGTPAALELFTGKSCVDDWDYPLDVGVGRRGTGCGNKPAWQPSPLSQRLTFSIQRREREYTSPLRPVPKN